MSKNDHAVANALMNVLQFSLMMIVPIGLLSLIGWWIGEKTGISWMMIPFFFLGALGGANAIYRSVKASLKENPHAYPRPAKKGKKEKDVKTLK